jgi:nucleoside-diphosphate-sugar epimerase
LIIGGTGRISSHTANALLNKGNRLAIFSRGRSQAELSLPAAQFRGNRDHPEQLAQAIDEFKPDVVIDFCCFKPEQAEQAIGICSSRVHQYVLVSTCDAAGYPLKRLPVHELDPLNPPSTRYAENKQRCEQICLAKHKPGQFHVTVVRPLYSLGPNFLLSFFSNNANPLIYRIRNEWPVLVPGDGLTLKQPGYNGDVGRMIAEVAGASIAYGKAYYCGSERTVTHDEYIAEIGRAVGVEPRTVHIPADLIVSLGHEEIQKSIFHGVMRHSLSFSIRRFYEDFPHFQWKTPLVQGIRSYVEQADKDNAFIDADLPSLEDRLIAAWESASEAFRRQFSRTEG